MDAQNEHIGRITKALFISGALNIVLIAGAFYWLIREVPPNPYCELKPALQGEEQVSLALAHGNPEIIRNDRSLSLEQLVAKLSDTQLVENGFTVRDLALGALVTFHHFDLSRALLGQAQPTQQRTIPYGKTKDGTMLEITVYPGLIEPQFQAIIQYANTERWPLTTQGIYALLRKQGGQYDSSLVDAFYLTPEFLTVEMLFNRSDKAIEKKELLTLLCQGDWKLLSTFAEQQKMVQDLSPARRQRFLVDYIDRESRSAAYLLLKTDPSFAIMKLDDEHVLAMLNLLVEKTPETEQFVKIILANPRSDAVWTVAATRLYEYNGDVVPVKNISQEAVAKYIKPAAEPEAPKKEKPKVVVVAPVAKPVKTTVAVVPQPKESKAIETLKHPPKITATNTSKKEKKVVATASTVQNDKPKVAVKQTPAVRRPRMYIVSEGDSLWKIAKRFDADADVIRECNHLKSDKLKPGTALLIP